MFGIATRWFFGPCFAGSMAVKLVSLELMRKQVNTSLPDGSKIGWNPPAQSLGAHFSKSHMYAHYLSIMTMHRNCYPSSLLPDIALFGAAGCIVSFVGILVSGMIA